ncbi:DNA polymerase-3 subunit gamma/tau [Jezberella montanilacus]|uniref:DNA polymerase III subunit gamma/tau n=1 Tax=Jezberella montanilacus TaxID=323426 RepID=A0A2T0XKT7_9BURK|nr:DNA polymerase III subunit gamma/tau [Jezberella montanilacus]PRY99553.1 DNA polymerase-3 subunit gamma/tau [Jezberella montanilacus]
MSYLVLARKWRPRSFDTLVGQDHVVRALTHALNTQRLHHAWLFTGTRGVGKTTLSRILAKALNCEAGITATPCGVCQACTEIDSGRFVDYLELDAASNRGVDEMTQLLEQAVYSPSTGRFKVYMIDEVHMLTGHAFNAMLKTLEEPPAHVKFILATTDPQKIPVTVLSRCLQFNLKQMPGESIVGHLQNVLGEEHIPFELAALRMLGQAASGSMRDALSLTDQAIAYSAGNLTEESVRGMLGTIDQKHLIRLLDALQAGQATAVLEVADELATRGLSYRAALADLAILLSRIAIAQRIGKVVDQADPLAGDIGRLAETLPHDAVQLFYTVAVHSRSELSIAPDEYAGFVMSCLRMLSLYSDPAAGNRPALQASAAPSVKEPAVQQMASVPSEPPAPPLQVTKQDEPPAWVTESATEFSVSAATVESTPVEAPSRVIRIEQSWAIFSASLKLSGLAAQLARQSELVGISANTLTLKIANKALSEGVAVDRLKAVLSEHFGVKVQLRFEIGADSGQSAHAIDVAAQSARQKAAEEIVQQDAFVQVLVKEFGAQVIPGSVHPGPTLQ